ncbi:iron-containing alcohol dehydrogenase [Roseibium sp.]|uniref:iron-containing alcohol dehydrogenase n=1 Tax=Roseibium sp. TaxID=1936156 RepID=UPI00326463D4
MTLITYPTRVHFADGVLEDALYSELEKAGATHPLLIFDSTLVQSELSERVQTGLPSAAKPRQFSFARHHDLRHAAAQATGLAPDTDAIVAFGSARAIELGRKCRYALSRTQTNRPELYVVPGADGLPNPCTRKLESWRAGLPSVLICDPTVTLDADSRQSQRTAVLSLIRCFEAYLTNAYNPPADGMALDGLTRCVVNLPRIGKLAGIDLQRELMAACLNAALSQEKGLGPSLTMSAALARTNPDLDEAEIARLVLPGVIRKRVMAPEKADILLKVLGRQEDDLHQAVGRILSAVPMADSLAGMGISRTDLDDAADAVATTQGLDVGSARSVLESIYEEGVG